ncbi:MAG: hypothetical protein AVDCRST_MAG36-465, partial [uncultured Nocardioidaceae bacterium]
GAGDPPRTPGGGPPVRGLRCSQPAQQGRRHGPGRPGEGALV